MHSVKGIYWLSSYYKSGNTWFRVFLANLLNPTNSPIHINKVADFIHDDITTNRAWFDQICGFNSNLLTHEELNAIKPDIYSWYNQQQVHVTYHKTHDVYNHYINSKNNCLGAIYFVRNPLDVAISFANHLMCTIDEAIAFMGNKTFSMDTPSFIHQNIFSWSMHVSSWIDAKQLPCLVLRYEDMHFNPQSTFTKAVEFLNLDVTSESITKALAFSQFHQLQQTEAQSDFLEKPPKLVRFFRKGIIDDWKNTLTQAQIDQIIHDHGNVMKRMGYIE